MALTKSDFENEKYRVNEVLARIASELDPLIYFAPGFFTDLSDESKRYRDDGDETGASLFRLLAEVSSMGFWGTQSTPKQPFAPMWTNLIPDKRSCLPEDFSGADLDFLAEVVCDIKEPVIQAQTADILWLRKHGERGGYDFAILAHDSYLASISLDSPSFYMWERLARALKLTELLSDDARRENALELAKKFADALLDTDHFTLWSNVTELLATYSEEEKERTRYAEQFWQRADEVEEAKGYDYAIRFREHAISVFGAIGNTDRVKEAQLKLSEKLVTYAEREADSGDFWTAERHIEHAISLVPNTREMKQHRNELGARLAQFGKKANENMDWKEERIAPSQEVLDAIDEQAVKTAKVLEGMSLEEALETLAAYPYPINADTARQVTEEVMRDSLAAKVASFQQRSHSGKVVGRNWPISSGWYAKTRRVYHVAGVVMPAINQIISDNDVNLEDFVRVVERSDFVPQRQHWTFAYGLSVGIKREFVAVAHILPPMLENAFREILASMGINTSRLDKDLVSEEKSLGENLDHPAIGKILGADLLFDLKTLLLKEEDGFNLRNSVSHGLMSDSNFFLAEDGKNSRELAQVVYLWWIALKLCFGIKRTERTE